MEVLCKSDYQDVYRIKEGVLLVINKFKYKCNENGYRMFAYGINRINSKTYAKGCKDLKIVTKRIVEKYGTVYEIGQVIYQNYPVELVSKEEWNYQIKTTGELFNGNQNEMLKLLMIIDNIISEKKEGENYVCENNVAD